MSNRKPHIDYNDPQNAPDTYVEIVKRLIDIDGVEIILFRDQDGVEWVSTAEEYEQGPDDDGGCI